MFMGYYGIIIPAREYKRVAVEHGNIVSMTQKVERVCANERKLKKIEVLQMDVFVQE